MFGRKMEHMLVHRITQERPPLGPLAQCLGNERHAAPLRDQAADVEAPVGIEVVHHPVVTVHIGQLVDHIGQMGGKIGAGARLAQIPHDVARGDDKRGDQGPYPMPDVLVLTFLRLPRGNRLRRVLPLQHLHPRLFIGADDHTTVLEKSAEPGDIKHKCGALWPQSLGRGC